MLVRRSSTWSLARIRNLAIGAQIGLGARSMAALLGRSSDGAKLLALCAALGAHFSPPPPLTFLNTESFLHLGWFTKVGYIELEKSCRVICGACSVRFPTILGKLTMRLVTQCRPIDFRDINRRLDTRGVARGLRAFCGVLQNKLCEPTDITSNEARFLASFPRYFVGLPVQICDGVFEADLRDYYQWNKDEPQPCASLS